MMKQQQNIAHYNIAGIAFEVSAGIFAIETTHTTAVGFITNEIATHSGFHVTLSAISENEKTEIATAGFEGKSFDANTVDFDWTIHTREDKELLIINFHKHQTWKRVELTIENNNIYIKYLPISIIPEKLDFYLFPLTNLLISRILHHQNGVMIHSSGVLDNGKGYIFTAVSGTGKSTMARLWQQKGATIINDDIIAVTTTQGIDIHNIPMPYYHDTPRKAPLNAVFIINQSPVNYIRPLKGAKAVMLLMANCIQQFGDSSYIQKHLATISNITAHTPIHELGFKPDTEIVDMIRNEIG